MDRWRNTFVVAEESLRRPAIHDVLRRIERSMAEELPESCALRLGHWFDQSAEDVWLIRELNLTYTVDLSKPGAGDVAPEWSEQLAVRLAQVISRGADADEGVLYFASRAAYLVQFVLDLIAGRAWTKWYYEEFHSLAMLSPSRAIAESLTREPDVGARALAHLAEIGRLDEALQVLNAADARTIYRYCFSGGQAAASDAFPGTEFAALPGVAMQDSHSITRLWPWIGRLLETWKDTPPHPAGQSFSMFHHALRWLALNSVRFRGLAIEPFACAAVEELIELRRALEETNSPILADRLVRELVEGTITLDAAVDLASQNGATSPRRALHFLLAAAQGDSDWAVQAAAVLLKEQLPPAAAILACESMVSSFAGMFLLGPPLVRLNEFVQAAIGACFRNEGLGRARLLAVPPEVARDAALATEGAPARSVEAACETRSGPEESTQHQPAEQIAGYLRYLILLKCAGSSRTFDATFDAALRLLSGCSTLAVRDGLQACPTFDLDRAYASLLRTLPALTECNPRCLLAETIPLPAQGRELLLLRDIARNEWIHLSMVPPEACSREQAIITGLDLIGESAGSVSVLLLHPSIAEMAGSALVAGKADHIVPLQRDSYSDALTDLLLSTRCISDPLSREKYVSLLGSSEQEVAYFSFANLWPDFDLTLDLFGVLLSRAALRHFARRLMGFQTSSPEHLYRNFLEGAGAVRNLPGRIEVELPRSPLLLVLQLSGLTRQSYTVPWLEGKEVCLLPPKE
jgi:hypothetical protein